MVTASRKPRKLQIEEKYEDDVLNLSSENKRRTQL